jgi:hypothetical protein
MAYMLQNMETKNFRAYPEDINRVKKYGQSGDSLAVALHKLLDFAERPTKSYSSEDIGRPMFEVPRIPK